MLLALLVQHTGFRALVAPRLPRGAPRISSVDASIELQQDCGRGQEHLSARLTEGDVCVYQVGTWMVDNVLVGSGDPARFLLARVDVLQINWTTDCEHGRIIGTACQLDGEAGVHIDEDTEYAGIEFGPEQLVARGPAEWIDEYSAELLSPLPSTLPAHLPEPEMLPVRAQADT